MIPILYSTSETSFTSNGLGRLTDCISCLVTEERNGIFECEFQYPITGKLYNEMVTNGGIISVTHDDAKDRQPFDIYKYSAPIDGIVTFNARHISYRLSGITVKPFTAASCALALQGIGTNSLSTNPFSFWTDKAVTSTFTLSVPTSAKAILAGQQGSILDVYGKGEYKFDKFDVKLYTNRGTNSGVTIRYGKNLSDTLVEKDNGEYYNAIVPYWKGEDGTLVTLTGWYVVQTGETLKYCVPVDFSSEFQSQPTELELRTKATAYLANNTPWLPKENIKVDFVQLWNTDEYKNVAVLERVKLCDTVAIYYPALGLTNSSAKVIKVVYDTLLERYTSIELGEPKQTLAEAIMQPYAQAIASISDKASVSFMEEAIQAATDLITGGLGGHVVINRNANGEPEEILIMDTDDTSTAVNVWRWNLNGLAHSHSGYNGPFDDIAITQDGKINASMITTGTLNAAMATIINLSANSIYGGTLTVGGANNQNGIIRILDSSGNEAGSITNTQFYSHRTHAGILEEADLNSGYLRLRTDGTQSALITRDSEGGGAIQLHDSAGTGRIVMFAQGNTIALRDANGAQAILAQGRQINFRNDNGNLGLTLSPSMIFMDNIDGKTDFRMSNSTTPDKKDIELFYIDTDYHDAVELGKTATDAHLRLYSPDNLHNIILDTLNGSMFKSPVTDAAGLTVRNGITADTATVTGLTAYNATVNGVLDVTKRRCYNTLSSAGWYRVLTFNSDSANHSNGYAGSTIDFNIGYKGQNETHKISLHIVNGNIKFDCENSVSYSQLIDKIRYTKNGAVGNVDLHILGECPGLYVDFIVHDQPAKQYQYVAANLVGVDPSPSGETIVTEHTFSSTAYSKTVSAEGTANGWDYILYTDKTVDATRKITDTVSSYTTVNGFAGYYIANIATPFTMSNADYYVGTEWAIGNGFAVPAAVMSKTTSKFNAYALGTASGSQSVSLTMHIKGTIA